MYKEIEILNTDFENKYLIRLDSKTMHVGFVVKDIIEFLKEGRPTNEMQGQFKNKYDVDIDAETIDDIIENKINPFVIKNVDTSFKKIFTLFNPSVIPVSGLILSVFDRFFFYSTGLVLLLANAYFFYDSIRNEVDSTLKSGLGYVILFLILIIHEIGHWLAAKRYHTTVREIGFGWYIFLPVFYVDLNEVWRLSSQKRIIINLSGIYLQLVCGLALLFFSTLSYGLKDMFIMVFFMNFSIAILNLNPFLKFDGYWVLSDLLEGRDLSGVSNTVLKKWMRFKKSNESVAIQTYSILKGGFMIFIIVSFTRFFYASISNLYTTRKVETASLFTIVFLALFFYKIFKNKIFKLK